MDNGHFDDSHDDDHVPLLQFQRHSTQYPRILYRDVDANDSVFADLVFDLIRVNRIAYKIYYNINWSSLLMRIEKYTSNLAIVDLHIDDPDEDVHHQLRLQSMIP